MFITANARPRPIYGFNGRLCMERCASVEKRERNRAPKNGKPGYKAGDEYRKDFTVDADRYRMLLRSKIMPEIRSKPVTVPLSLARCSYSQR